MGEKKLFIGNEEAQLEDDQIVVGYANHEYGINLEKVVDLESAKNAIDLIIEQGEGVLLGPPKGSKTIKTLLNIPPNIKAIKNIDCSQ